MIFLAVNRTEVWTISGQSAGPSNRETRMSLDNFMVVDVVRPGYKNDRALPPPYSERKSLLDSPHHPTTSFNYYTEDVQFCVELFYSRPSFIWGGHSGFFVYFSTVYVIIFSSTEESSTTTDCCPCCHQRRLKTSRSGHFRSRRCYLELRTFFLYQCKYPPCPMLINAECFYDSCIRLEEPKV